MPAMKPNLMAEWLERATQTYAAARDCLLCDVTKDLCWIDWYGVPRQTEEAGLIAD